MDHTIRHPWYEDIERLATYESQSEPPPVSPYLPTNLKKFGKDFIIFNLATENEERQFIIITCIIMLISFVLAVILVETEVIYVPKGPVGETFFEDWWPIFAVVGFWELVFLSLTKIFAHVHYLVFQGEQVIMYTRRWGTWQFDLEDLRFHVFKESFLRNRYFLEVEIPEFTYPDELSPELALPDLNFPEHHRMLILEVAARKETIDGMLAVLLPLMRGDTGPYDRAQKRCFVPIPENENPGLWRRWRNLEGHFHAWFMIYKINQFLFWWVHGDKKKVLREHGGDPSGHI